MQGDTLPRRSNNPSSKMAISPRLRGGIRTFRLKWNSPRRLFSRIIWRKIQLSLRREWKMYRKISPKVQIDRRLLIIVNISFIQDSIRLRRRTRLIILLISLWRINKTLRWDRIPFWSWRRITGIGRLQSGRKSESNKGRMWWESKRGKWWSGNINRSSKTRLF